MLPYFGYSMTSSLSGTTDSAAAATAMATGYKTYNRYLGLDGDKVARKSLTELAVELSMGAAIFTTDTLTGATPSGFTVHVEDRGDSDEIRRQQSALTADFGVVIDGTYQQYTKNIMKLIEREFSEALDKIADEDGIFVMYEEAHIDKSCSSLNIDNAFLSLIRFNQIIGRVMEYAFYHPNTMVIITADHETGDLIIDEEGRPLIQTEEHTSKNVPIFAYGVGAEVFDGKTIENTEIPKIISSLWGVSDFAK
jgi:alkaline phosphatase